MTDAPHSTFVTTYREQRLLSYRLPELVAFRPLKTLPESFQDAEYRVDQQPPLSYSSREVASRSLAPKTLAASEGTAISLHDQLGLVRPSPTETRIR